MLPRTSRLPATQRLRHPSIIDTPYFSLRLAPSRMVHSRFGVTISKKVDKRATKRNEIRRLFMREMAGLITDVVPPRDILVIVKPQAAVMSLDELAKVFTQALQSYRQQ